MKVDAIGGLLVAVLALGCSAEPRAELEYGEDALVVSAAARLGTIDYGAHETIAYTGNPRYRAYSFVAAAGEAVELDATSTDGDPVLWLTNSSFASLERNDDAAPGDTSARIERKLKNAGTYWLVVSEAKRRPATITVSLNRTSDSREDAGTGGNGGVAFKACPDGRGTRCFTLEGSCYDSFACPVQGKLDVQSFVNGTFRWESGTLWPVAGSSSLSVAGDELNQVMFREKHPVRIDGTQHGIASTTRQNDVYATATDKPDGVELAVKFVAQPGSPYANAATCRTPRRGGGGSCTLRSAP